jgi:citrate synthase
MGELHWDTQITKIQPNEIRVRGYRLDELMGRINFGQAVYLILTGEMPGENIGRMMEMIMVTSIDHGTTPPSTLAARTAASTGAPLNAALAAGILTINKHHGGAVEACMEMLLKGRALNVPPAEAAKKIVAEAKEQKVRLSGFGHRLHTADPRTRKLLASAREFEVAGPHVELIEAIEAVFAAGGKPLPINVDGALAAILCELGFPVSLANLFFIMARVPGLAAHILEEQTKEKPMRKIHPTDCGYTGPEDRGL